MKLIGRRVKIIRAEDSTGALGKVGTIVENDGYGGICVRIEDWDQGHGGANDLQTDDHWYFTRGAVRLLPQRRKTRKKVRK